MLFIFKNKKIVVDTFTYRAEIFDNFAIKKSANFYPDWWKQNASKP